eukprot:EG_transcript_23468
MGALFVKEYPPEVCLDVALTAAAKRGEVPSVTVDRASVHMQLLTSQHTVDFLQVAGTSSMLQPPLNGGRVSWEWAAANQEWPLAMAVVPQDTPGAPDAHAPVNLTWTSQWTRLVGTELMFQASALVTGSINIGVREGPVVGHQKEAKVVALATLALTVFVEVKGDGALAELPPGSPLVYTAPLPLSTSVPLTFDGPLPHLPPPP